MSEQKTIDPERRKKIRIALARADAFWAIIGKAGIGMNLGMKIGKVSFDSLSDAEKIVLAKISTDLVKAHDEITIAFAEAENKEAELKETEIKEAENKEAENKEAEEKPAQVTVSGIEETAQETYTPPEIKEVPRKAP